MKALNRHTASIDGIQKGAVGEVDPRNPGIRAMLDAGHLVPVEGESADEGERGPTADEAQRMVEEIDRRGARIRELEAEVTELRAQLAKKPTRARTDPAAEG